MKLKQLLVAGVMLPFLSYSAPINESKVQSYELKFNRSSHGVVQASVPRNTFTFGDSLDTLSRRQQDEANRRDLQAREGRSGGSSPAYENSEAIRLYQDSTNNCVRFALRQAGISRSVGAGGRYGINSQEPKVGAVGVEKEIIHAVYITKVEGDMITFSESNYQRGWITQRTLPRSAFIGFIQ
jgi:hypothetical protein